MARLRVEAAILLLWGCSPPQPPAELHPEAGLIRRPGLLSTRLLQTAAATYAAYGRVDDTERLAITYCEPPPPATPRRSESRDPVTHGTKLYFLFAKDRAAYLNAKDQTQPDGQVLVKESWIPGKVQSKGPLFLMMKQDGVWVYATATSDGRELTASGEIASCMKCHEDAPYDKLFGNDAGKRVNFMAEEKR